MSAVNVSGNMLPRFARALIKLYSFTLAFSKSSIIQTNFHFLSRGEKSVFLSEFLFFVDMFDFKRNNSRGYYIWSKKGKQTNEA